MDTWMPKFRSEMPSGTRAGANAGPSGQVTSRSFCLKVDVSKCEWTAEKSFDWPWADEGEVGSEVGAVLGENAASDDEVEFEMDGDLAGRPGIVIATRERLPLSLPSWL